MEIKRKRPSSSVPGMAYPSGVQDAAARDALAEVQDRVASLGIEGAGAPAEVVAQPESGVIAELQNRLSALEEALRSRGDGRHRVRVVNGGPGESVAFRDREDQAFFPGSVAEIIGRKLDCYVVTTPTESNLPPWKLVFISESGLGYAGSYGFAYPAVSGFNRARVRRRANPDTSEVEYVSMMTRLGTLQDCDFLDGSLMRRDIGGSFFYNERSAGFVCLSNGPCIVSPNSFEDLYDIAPDYQTFPGFHFDRFGNSVLPAIPKHGQREAVVLDTSYSPDDVIHVWRAIAGMPEYTPGQMLSDMTGVPAEQPNPWGEWGGA
jgi:hypothetical protein